MNDKVIRRGRTTMPFGLRRSCDVCHLLEAEHSQPLGNDCYRRIVAVRFPLSAVARQSFPTALQAHEAAVRGSLLQGRLEGLWKALGRVYQTGASALERGAREASVPTAPLTDLDPAT